VKKPCEESAAGSRIDSTLKRSLRTRGEVACQFDELSEDILANRIIASTLRSVRRSGSLTEDVREEVALVASRFPHGSPLHITSAHFSAIMVHRNNRFYRFLLDVCRLIQDNLISDQSASGALRFRDFREDEATMHKLFEDFVRNLLKVEQSEFTDHSPKISWNVSDTDDHSQKFLPDMQTDIVLENVKMVRIIDTKFYQKPLAGHHDVPKLRSDHLYQLQSYIHNWPHPDRSARRDVDGLLLCAATGEAFRLRYRIPGRPIAAITLGLDAEWAAVRESLLSVCASSNHAT
jgi:5-methylcytosine-specific restriction enzyme subunit McrC